MLSHKNILEVYCFRLYPKLFSYLRTWCPCLIRILILLEGKVDIKLLKRTATFDLCIRPTLAIQTQNSLSIPKRSNVFIEQTLREREHCKGKYLQIVNKFNNKCSRLVPYYIFSFRDTPANATNLAIVTNYSINWTYEFNKTKDI